MKNQIRDTTILKKANAKDSLPGTVEYSFPWHIQAQEETANISGRECSKKHALSLSKGPSSKAGALLTRGAYMEYVSTAKGRERRWWLFSTFPFNSQFDHSIFPEEIHLLPPRFVVAPPPVVVCSLKTLAARAL
jgi:hypothetical protein